MGNWLPITYNRNNKTMKKELQSKGDRLNWSPLKESKPVKLTSDLLQGKKLTSADLKERSSKNPNPCSIILVP